MDKDRGEVAEGTVMRVDELYSQEGNIKGIENLPRFVSLLQKAIDKLELDLRGLVVLTEAASGNYVCTPVIAAMSGAEKVYAYARDSSYGTTREIFGNTEKLARLVGVDDRIAFLETLDKEHAGEADIVTNLGPLRPVREEFIHSLKDTAVVPLMRETWEFREGEVDLRACRDRGIIVLGTNENHPLLVIFDYLGHLCAKKLFEMGVEILQSRIVVFGGGEFGLNIMKYLARLGANVLAFCHEDSHVVESLGARRLGGLTREDVDITAMKNTDAIIVTTYPDQVEVVGENGLITPKELKATAPGVSVIQFKGNVDRDQIQREGIALLPKEAPKAGHMSWTLTELGPKTVVDLHAGGLKVGEITARLRLGGCSPEETVERALEHELVQDFSDEQKRRFVS